MTVCCDILLLFFTARTSFFSWKTHSLPKLNSTLSALLSCIANQERGRYMRLMPSPPLTYSENWFDHLKPPQMHTEKPVHSVSVRWTALQQLLKYGGLNVPDVGMKFGQGFWHFLDSLPSLNSEAQQQNSLWITEPLSLSLCSLEGYSSILFCSHFWRDIEQNWTPHLYTYP